MRALNSNPAGRVQQPDAWRVAFEAEVADRFGCLIDAGLPAICVECRHMAAALRAQSINKSDRNDARGIAQMMRVGLFKAVHVKTGLGVIWTTWRDKSHTS